jgi:hypothetical protein
MSSFSTLLIGLTIGETILQTIDSIAPKVNPIHWLSKKVVKLSKKESFALKKIDQLKDRILRNAQIESDKVQIYPSSTPSLFKAHGTIQSGIIQINKKILEQTIYGREKSKVATQTIQFLNQFIDKAPEDIEGMRHYLKKMKEKDLRFFKDLMINEGYSLSEDELLFCLAHEIMGHLKHKDNVYYTCKSSMIRLGLLTLTETIIHNLNSINYNFILRLSTYLFSKKLVGFFTSSTDEKKSDIAASKYGYLEGGIRLFKRLYLKSLLENDNFHTPPKIKDQNYHASVGTRYRTLISFRKTTS